MTDEAVNMERNEASCISYHSSIQNSITLLRSPKGAARRSYPPGLLSGNVFTIEFSLTVFGLRGVHPRILFEM